LKLYGKGFLGNERKEDCLNGKEEIDKKMLFSSASSENHGPSYSILLQSCESGFPYSELAEGYNQRIAPHSQFSSAS